jgi:putative FmdB family regulatory protein
VPTYDYQCRSCGSVTEVIHSMIEEGPSVCELCGGTLRRVLYPTGIIFKGSGFYRNDSRAASGTSSGSSGSSSSGSSSGNAPAGSGDGKAAPTASTEGKGKPSTGGETGSDS